MSGRKDQLTAVESMTSDQRIKALRRIENESYVCMRGVSQQAQRLRQDYQCAPEYMADGRALVYFFRNVVRAAVTARLLLPREHLAALDEALARISAACPHAKDARDALEHFDDYILGVGHQQNRRPGEYTQNYERGGQRVLIRVGILEIDADLAEQATLHLHSILVIGKDLLG